MRAAVISLAAIAGLVLLLAWNTHSATTGAAHRPLSVLCAPALKPPVEALARAYEEETGVPVQLEYGGSQVILARAASGADGDLFLPADDDYVRMAEERGLISETFPLARPLPELAGAEALVAVAVLRSSRQPEAARAFARYLTAPDRGSAEFRRRGYRTP